MFFQHENRFRYKFFDIVQFSRSCAPQPTGWRLDYFITEVIFCQALFFEAFRTFWTWIASDFSELTGIFQRLLVLFSCFSAEASEVILLSQRLALKYNTIHPSVWQPLFSTFLPFFLGSAFLPVFCVELASPLTRWTQLKKRPCVWAAQALSAFSVLYIIL